MKKNFDEYVDVDTCSAKDVEGANHAICNPPPSPLLLLPPQPSSSPALAGGACGRARAGGSPQERCFCVWYPPLPRTAMKDKVKEKVVQAVSDELEVPPLDKLRFKRRACRVFGGQLTIDTIRARSSRKHVFVL